MSINKKAVIAGHVCIDITPEFLGAPVKELSNVLSPGRLVNMGGVDIHTGGTIANTGLAMKLFGIDVSLMGKIGKDDFGSLIWNYFDEHGCTDGMIVSEDVQTSYTVALAVPGVDRILLHNPGANDVFHFEDMNMDIIKQADLFHFGYPPLMKSMFIDEGSELEKIMKSVHEQGIVTSLDMASIDPNAESGRAPWKTILKKVLPFVDFFVPSVEELCYMLDRERYDEWVLRANGKDITEFLTVSDIAPLAEQVLDLGASVVLIKSGVPGMYYKTASKEKMQPLCEKLSLSLEEWAEMEGFEASYVPEIVRSGTGCGDTSIAAFLTSVLSERSLTDALKLATATGASCVTAFDALSGLKSFAEMEEKIASGWEKVTIKK